MDTASTHYNQAEQRHTHTTKCTIRFNYSLVLTQIYPQLFSGVEEHSNTDKKDSL